MQPGVVHYEYRIICKVADKVARDAASISQGERERRRIWRIKRTFDGRWKSSVGNTKRRSIDGQMTVDVANRFDVSSNNRTIIRRSLVLSIGNDIISAGNRCCRARVIVGRINDGQSIPRSLKMCTLFYGFRRKRTTKIDESCTGIYPIYFVCKLKN